eukprot:CFRG0534T1
MVLAYLVSSRKTATMSDYRTLKLQIDFETANRLTEASSVNSLITSALQAMHGMVGSAVDVEVTDMDEEIKIVTIRVHKLDVVKVWSALTMIGSYKDQRCRVVVKDGSVMTTKSKP